MYKLLGGNCQPPPDSPVELPSEADQIARFATVLRSRLNSASVDLSAMAERLQVAVASKVPRADSYQVAHHQWVLHYETFTDLKDLLAPLLPLVGKAYGRKERPRRGWIGEELDRVATTLLPSQSAQETGFPAGFQAATLRAVAVLRSHARRLR